MGRPPLLIRAMPERKRFFFIDVFPQIFIIILVLLVAFIKIVLLLIKQNQFCCQLFVFFIDQTLSCLLHFSRNCARVPFSMAWGGQRISNQYCHEQSSFKLYYFYDRRSFDHFDSELRELQKFHINTSVASAVQLIDLRKEVIVMIASKERKNFSKIKLCALGMGWIKKIQLEKLQRSATCSRQQLDQASREPIG